MFQYAIFLASTLRVVPLAVLLPGLDAHWISRLGHLLNL